MAKKLTPRELLRTIIRRNDGSISAAAKKLGCTRQHLGWILSGGSAGCNLAKRIEKYTKGEIKQFELACGGMR